jgi:hypothetical protein
MIIVNDSGEVTEWPSGLKLDPFSSLLLRVWDEKITQVHKEKKVNINVYPNPTEGVVRIISNGSTLKHLSILSLNGQKVLERKLANATERIDLGDFQNGLYLMIIEDNQSNRWIEKVMIAR